MYMTLVEAYVFTDIDRHNLNLKQRIIPIENIHLHTTVSTRLTWAPDVLHQALVNNYVMYTILVRAYVFMDMDRHQLKQQIMPIENSHLNVAVSTSLAWSSEYYTTS